MNVQLVVVSLLLAGFFGLLGIVISEPKNLPRWLGFVLGAIGLPGWIVLALIPKRAPRGTGAQG